MPGRRTRNNSSTVIESIRLKTRLFIPARVRPSLGQNSPCAFRVQTEYCILFRAKTKKIFIPRYIESRTTLTFVHEYMCVCVCMRIFFKKRKRRIKVYTHKGNKVLLRAWNTRTMLRYKIKMKSRRTCLIFNRFRDIKISSTSCGE